jgi:phosphoglycerate kinase
MQEIKSVKDADVSGKRVLVRVDYNVTLKDGVVDDDMRIKASIPTIELLRQKGASKITVMTHFGRPEGKVDPRWDLAPIRKHMAELGLQDVELLENLRFDPREEAGDESFAKELALHGDIYVNDAFSASHRAHASITGVPKLLPSYVGLELESEIQHLTAALTPPAGSLAVIGGAKFETKQPLIEKLLQKYSQLLLGGALGSDVIRARGWPVGASLISKIPVPENIAGDEHLLVANDAVVKDVDADAERTALVVDIQSSESIVDIGPATAKQWADTVRKAPFVLWNGPMGIYEDGFTNGTDALAEALSTSAGKAVIGGGDTATALQKFTFDVERVFVSTGGGAMLEFLVDGTLPGIEALKH